MQHSRGVRCICRVSTEQLPDLTRLWGQQGWRVEGHFSPDTKLEQALVLVQRQEERRRAGAKGLN